MTTWRYNRAMLVLGMLSLAACASPPQQTGDTQPSSGASAQPSQPPSPSTSAPSDMAQPASSDVELTLDRNRYAVGAQVRLTIRSRTRDTLGFNPCTRLLERQEGQRWVTYTEPTRICTMELWLLEPNTTRSATTELPASISKGTYRMVLLLSRQKPAPSNAPPNWATVRAVSATFEVE